MLKVKPYLLAVLIRKGTSIALALLKFIDPFQNNTNNLHFLKTGLFSTL